MPPIVVSKPVYGINSTSRFFHVVVEGFCKSAAELQTAESTHFTVKGIEARWILTRMGKAKSQPPA